MNKENSEKPSLLVDVLEIGGLVTFGAFIIGCGFGMKSCVQKFEHEYEVRKTVVSRYADTNKDAFISEKEKLDLYSRIALKNSLQYTIRNPNRPISIDNISFLRNGYYIYSNELTSILENYKE
jgi:hypothetical protein